MVRNPTWRKREGWVPHEGSLPHGSELVSVTALPCSTDPQMVMKVMGSAWRLTQAKCSQAILGGPREPKFSSSSRRMSSSLGASNNRQATALFQSEWSLGSAFQGVSGIVSRGQCWWFSLLVSSLSTFICVFYMGAPPKVLFFFLFFYFFLKSLLLEKIN